MFWFKYKTEDCLPLLSYETALQTFAKLNAIKGHQPLREEIVLVKHLTMNKWVRCKVEEVTEIEGVPQYTVWLIDYGYVVLV